MVEMTVGSMFSGIGGLDLGLERAGMKVIWQCEIEPWCAGVLAKHWPHVPNLGDVTAVDWSTVDRPRLLAGGFPCQPVSDAGLKLAHDDVRWLWPEMRRAIDALRPEWIVIENVPGLRNRGLATVRDDLDAMGYLARPVSLAACELGAPHPRRRLFTLAHAVGERMPTVAVCTRKRGPGGQRKRRPGSACRRRLVGRRTPSGSSGLWVSRSGGPRSRHRKCRRPPGRRVDRPPDHGGRSMIRMEFGTVLDDGTYICDGCNVREGHMHRCHRDDGAWADGRSCQCRECRCCHGIDDVCVGAGCLLGIPGGERG